MNVMRTLRRGPAATRLRAAAVLPVLAALLSPYGSSIHAAEVREQAIKLGYIAPLQHPQGVGATRFAELVAAKSGGRMKVKGYSDGQLGAEVQMASAAQGGVLEMAALSTAPLTGIVKEFSLLDFPFLFDSAKEADAVLDGPVGRRLLDKLSEKGLVGLCYWENGFRQVTNNRRPIARMEDLAGLKIRTMQSPVFVQVFSALGANAVPMAFTELYAALESKAVDAQENPYAIIVANKFNEVQKYLSATRHVYSSYVLVAGKKFWDRLNADERKILADACTEAQGYQRSFSRQLDTKLVADLKAKGMAFNDVSPAELSRIREKVKPVIEKYAKDVGEDLVRQTYAEIEKVRSQK